MRVVAWRGCFLFQNTIWVNKVLGLILFFDKKLIIMVLEPQLCN